MFNYAEQVTKVKAVAAEINKVSRRLMEIEETSFGPTCEYVALEERNEDLCEKRMELIRQFPAATPYKDPSYDCGQIPF